MQVLVVDNYDSFVFNLVQYLGQLGVDAQVWRNDDDRLGSASDIAAAATEFDGVLLSPGPGTPERAGASIPLVHACAAARTPLLGVCLGHQAIGQAFGGRDHTTVLHACRKIKELRETDARVDEDYANLSRILTS